MVDSEPVCTCTDEYTGDDCSILIGRCKRFYMHVGLRFLLILHSPNLDTYSTLGYFEILPAYAKLRVWLAIFEFKQAYDTLNN